jgi:hypothetical protein
MQIPKSKVQRSKIESAARYNENTKEQSSKIKDGIRCAV